MIYEIGSWVMALTLVQGSVWRQNDILIFLLPFESHLITVSRDWKVLPLLITLEEEKRIVRFIRRTKFGLNFALKIKIKKIYGMTLKLMRVYQRAAPTTQAADPYQTGIFSVSSPAPMIVLSPTLLWPIFSVNSVSSDDCALTHPLALVLPAAVGAGSSFYLSTKYIFLTWLFYVHILYVLVQGLDCAS